MKPSGFIARYNPIAVYHFTEWKNVPSIRSHGIVSYSELCEQSIGVYKFGGNDLSRNLDSFKGLDNFVHLCFTENHPMAYVAQKEGRIDCLTYIKIKPEVLLLPGVMGCDVVATKKSAEILPIDQILDKLNFEVIYSQWHDIKDPEWEKGRRAEILIPKVVDPKYILDF